VRLDILLEPISEESPCGVDLEYDDEFRQLEEIARGKPGSVIDPDKPGASIAAIPPDWHEAKSMAESILTKSKDLRALMYLVRAALAGGELAEVAALLRAATGMCEQFWGGVYPLLDAEDDNDPTMRVNALACLSDSDDVLKLVRETALFRHPVLGVIKFRSLETALGVLPDAGGETTLSQSDAEGAVLSALETSPENLVAIAQMLEAARALEAKVDELAGSRSTFDLKPLFQRLKPVADFVEGLRGQATEGEEAVDGVAGGSGGGPSKSGQMNRDEAKRMILKACEFLEKTEPSSPAPLFLKRAVALMEMNFLDIVRDLAPDALGTFEHYGGNRQNSE
jgi:type VI secretion system protein ImpA